MKLFLYCIVSLILLTSIATSCSDTVTYADQVAAENSLIADFIKRDTINVISTFPTNTAYWNEHPKDYVRTSSGLYFHLLKAGGGAAGDTIKTRDLIITRYEAYTLSAVPDVTVSNLSTSAFPNPPSFLFGSGVYTGLCAAFNEAAAHMKRNDAEAMIIVPSKIGFSADAQSIKPMRYLLRIKFLRY